MLRRCDAPASLCLLLLALLACNSSTEKPAARPTPNVAGTRAKPPAISQREWTPPAGAAPSATDAPNTGDAPEISRSPGSEGGAVVLWPRIVLPRGAGQPDAETLALAAKVQAHLAEVARHALGARPVETRPEPERVCPKVGCKAVSLGVLLARAGNGCSVIALVSAPGPSAARLVTWSPGTVRLTENSVPFREPPERVVKVDDYASCAKLPGELAAKDGEIEAAIVAAAGL